MQICRLVPNTFKPERVRRTCAQRVQDLCESAGPVPKRSSLSESAGCVESMKGHCGLREFLAQGRLRMCGERLGSFEDCSSEASSAETALTMRLPHILSQPQQSLSASTQPDRLLAQQLLNASALPCSQLAQQPLNASTLPRRLPHRQLAFIFLTNSSPVISPSRAFQRTSL